MKLRIKSTNLTVKIIGWLQIVGGITGIGLMAYLMLNTGEINGALLLIFLIGLALFIFSIYTGKQLLNERSLKIGIILSIINQVFQLIQFKIAGYGLSYSSGSELLIGFSDNTIFNFAIITSSFNMSINTDGFEFTFMVNLMAIFILVVLFDIWEELRPEERSEETNENTDIQDTIEETNMTNQ